MCLATQPRQHGTVLAQHGLVERLFRDADMQSRDDRARQELPSLFDLRMRLGHHAAATLLVTRLCDRPLNL